MHRCLPAAVLVVCFGAVPAMMSALTIITHLRGGGATCLATRDATAEAAKSAPLLAKSHCC